MKDVVEVKSFQEKISDKIKDSIGDLITNEDLKPLIEKSIEDLLINDRKIKNHSGSYPQYNDAPPLMQEIITPLLEKQIKEQVNKYIADNPELLTKVIDDMIANGFVKVMIYHLDNKISRPLESFRQEIGDVFLKNNINI